MNYYSMVKEFHEAFNLPVDSPPDRELYKLRNRLKREEMTELLKEAVDVLYVLVGDVVAYSGDMEHISQEVLDDYLYSVVPELFDRDLFNEAFKRVHESNMSKLGEDGKPIYREDGKVLKGPNYKEPDFSDLI